MKDKITLKEFFDSEKKLAIHCNTEEKANKLLKEFVELGKTWWTGKGYLENTCFNTYKDKTCYTNNGEYSRIGFYKANGYKTYSFEDIIFEENKPKNLIPEIAKMLGVEIGEEFTLNQNKEQYIFDYRDGLMERVSEYVWEEPVDDVLNSLLLGEYRIKKLPKQPQLTEDEKAILRNLPKEYKWIARDGDDKLYIYTTEPNKEQTEWYNRGINNVFQELSLFEHLFQFIKWEDKEPYNIEELLKGE